MKLRIGRKCRMFITLSSSSLTFHLIQKGEEEDEEIILLFTSSTNWEDEIDQDDMKDEDDVEDEEDMENDDDVPSHKMIGE
jgi:hypothetical protein